MAASPDGVIENEQGIQGIIEIKCPYSCRNITINEACTSVKSFCCQLYDDSVTLKHNHNYYYQIQGSMAITGAQWCDFIVWSPKQCAVERIPFNPTFWLSTKLYLTSIYYNYILPELIYPRLPLSLDIIHYDFTPSKSYQVNHEA